MVFSSEVQGPALGSELGLLSWYLVQGRWVSSKGYAAVLVPGLNAHTQKTTLLQPCLTVTRLLQPCYKVVQGCNPFYNLVTRL